MGERLCAACLVTFPLESPSRKEHTHDSIYGGVYVGVPCRAVCLDSARGGTHCRPGKHNPFHHRDSQARWELAPLLGWDVVRGLYAVGRDSGEELARLLGERQAGTVGPVDALLLAQQLGEDGLLLYSNAHRFWNDPGVMQGIWDLRDPLKATGRMPALLAAPGATLPPELGQDVLVLDEPLPSTTHLEQIVRETFNAAKLDEPERSVIDKAVDALG